MTKALLKSKKFEMKNTRLEYPTAKTIFLNDKIGKTYSK